jgi:hypothetical protein
MGYFCWLCDSVTEAGTINLLIEHFHYRHAITALHKCRVRCGQLGCCRTFDNIQALRMHLKRQHPNDPYLEFSITEQGRLGENVSEADSETGVDYGEDVIFEEAQEIEDISVLRKTMNDFIISLKAKNVTQTVVSDAVHGVVSIAKLICSIVSTSLAANKINCEGVSQKICEIESALEDSSIAKSVYKLKKYLTDQHELVSPQEVFLKNRTELEHGLPSKNEKPSQKFVPETMQYISVIHTIQKILVDTNNFAGLQDQSSNVSHDDTHGDGLILSKFADCDLFRKHPLLLKDNGFLQIHLFYDEFETCNPLGSKANIHKLGGMYMSIRNFPEYLTSQLRNIFPVIYCYSSDAKKLGFNVILQPLVNDLMALENGLQMTVNGKSMCVYGSVTMWSGDNLGIHQIFGFSSNFKAERCCHFCYGDSQERQKLFRESEFVLRTKTTHNTDVGKSPDLMKEAGLTFHTSLAGLQTFSIPENVCPDAMHDILEGCLQYELKLVLHYLIAVDDDVSLTLDNFNSRMKLFCYGVDDKNKPQPLS